MQICVTSASFCHMPHFKKSGVLHVSLSRGKSWFISHATEASHCSGESHQLWPEALLQQEPVLQTFIHFSISATPQSGDLAINSTRGFLVFPIEVLPSPHCRGPWIYLCLLGRRRVNDYTPHLFFSAVPLMAEYRLRPSNTYSQNSLGGSYPEVCGVFFFLFILMKVKIWPQMWCLRRKNPALRKEEEKKQSEE